MFGFAINSYGQETIRLTNGEWPPFQSEKLIYYGIASRIVSEAFELEGVKVEYGFFPWKRAFEWARKGNWDGSLIWFDTPERRKDFYISNPVANVSFVFFHLKSYSFDWKTMDDLKGLKIGATIEADYGEAFQKAEKNETFWVDRLETDTQNFRMLLIKRVNLMIVDLDVGYATLQDQFSQDEIQLITHHPKPVKAAPHHVLLSKKVKKNKLMIDLLNKGLKRLRKSGKIDQYWIESRRGDYIKK